MDIWLVYVLCIFSAAMMHDDMTTRSLRAAYYCTFLLSEAEAEAANNYTQASNQ